MKPKVFIHTNARQLVGALVGQHSMRKHSRHNDAFEVEILRLEDQPHLHHRHGRRYLREGRRVRWNNDDLQSFTPLRFLPPQIMGYQGRALVTDPDVFACTDVYELLSRDMGDKAIVCRRIEPDDGRPPYFASSVMLLDCAKLRHWRWEEQIDAMFDFRLDYRAWISLASEDEDTIGELEAEWNHFDTLTSGTRLLHNTSRATQPWKTGLPIDFVPRQRPRRRKFGIIPRHQWKGFRSWLGGRGYRPYGSYASHPDPAQVEFFFRLVRECIESGVFDLEFLRSEIRRQHLRPDATDIVGAIRSA
jgi:hypothetical protein